MKKVKLLGKPLYVVAFSIAAYVVLLIAMLIKYINAKCKAKRAVNATEENNKQE